MTGTILESTEAGKAPKPAVLTLPPPGTAGSLGASGTISVDAAAPVVARIDSVVSVKDGKYGVGATLAVKVVFDKAVTVSGIPKLLLEVGTNDRTFDFSGMHTNVMGSATGVIFTGTVVEGDVTPHLDIVSTSSLWVPSGAAVRQAGLAAGINEANTVLPAPGTAGSLGANAALSKSAHRLLESLR